MLFDYVRIRFPTTDVLKVVEEILQLKLTYFLHEDYGFYSYSEHYHLGDIFVLCSHELDKGVLMELKGRGCRQFKSYLLAQGRSWYDFFIACLVAGGVMKRNFYLRKIFDAADIKHTLVVDEKQPDVPNRTYGYEQCKGDLECYYVELGPHPILYLSNMQEEYLLLSWQQASANTDEQIYFPSRKNPGTKATAIAFPPLF